MGIQKGIPFPLTTRRDLDLGNATLAEIEERYADRIPNAKRRLAGGSTSSAPRYKSSSAQGAKGVMRDLSTPANSSCFQKRRSREIGVDELLGTVIENLLAGRVLEARSGISPSRAAMESHECHLKPDLLNLC